ncbi:hypothetical protein Lal_00016968 [Lupinus albus]|nr:hypothetical protein Lal_00016968 [Lupinus albus]
MASQNEENEFGSQTPVSQKRTPHGVTSMKKATRARSKNVKNTLVSYIGVLVRQNVSITFSSWTDVRLNSVKDRIWEDITISFHAMKLLMLVRGTSITSSNLLTKLFDNSEPMPTNDSEMLMAMLNSNLQPNMQISLMRRIG